MSRAWWNETGLQARGPGSPPRKACRSWVGARFLASWKPRFPEEPGPRLQLGVVSAGTPLALCMHPCHSLLHLASARPPFVLLMRTVLPGGTGLLVWCPGCPAALALLGGLLSWDRVCSALAPPGSPSPPGGTPRSRWGKEAASMHFLLTGSFWHLGCPFSPRIKCARCKSVLVLGVWLCGLCGESSHRTGIHSGVWEPWGTQTSQVPHCPLDQVAQT